MAKKIQERRAARAAARPVSELPEGILTGNVVPKDVPDRLTLILQMHHQHEGDQATTIESRPWMALESKDVEPYSRRPKVTEEWQRLDTGWVGQQDAVGYIVVENLAGKGLQLHPSPEQAAEIAKQVVEIRLGKTGEGHLLVLPGWPQQFYPKGKDVYLRCQSGEASCRVTIIPK